MTLFGNNPSISVIIPVHNGGPEFSKCLESIIVSTLRPKDIIVVSDGDAENTWNLARDFATHVVRVPTQVGPARARNIGAHTARGDILFFIDADVAIRQDSIEHIVDAFKRKPHLAAVFGSYDDQPFQTNFMSQYKNLFHHYIHQTSNVEASTFWSGCGAIRREVFFEIDGFDEGYPRPSIEDIELGYRLKKAGYRIQLLKSVQVKHLKRWGFFSLLKADIFYRAIPWSHLIFREGSLIDDLNLKIVSRISVMLVYLLVLFLLVMLCLPWLSIASVFLMVILLWLNRDLYAFFLKKRGLYFVIRSVVCHWLYYFYSGGTLAVVFADYKARSALFRYASEKLPKD